MRSLNEYVPLPVVEVSHLAAAATGILLLVLARGLARGYRAALSATVSPAADGGGVLDPEGARLGRGGDPGARRGAGRVAAPVVHQAEAAATGSSRATSASRSSRCWCSSSFGDVRVSRADARAFRTSRRSSPVRWAEVERNRFLRSATALMLVVSAGAAYVLMRVPVRFRRLRDEEIGRALDLHAEIGGDTNAMLRGQRRQGRVRRSRARVLPLPDDRPVPRGVLRPGGADARASAARS